MTTTERDRYALLQRVEEVLGPEHARAAADLLPPSGWHDLATRADLQLLRSDLRIEMHDIELRIERSLRTSTYTNLAAISAFAGAVIAAVKL